MVIGMIPQPGFIETLLLPVFLLMTFALIAGADPTIVLRPVFEIAGRLFMMAFNLVFCVAGAAGRIAMASIANWIGNTANKRGSQPHVKATTTTNKDGSIKIRLK